MISIDGSSSRKLEANSYDKNVFFTLQFYLINFCLSGAGIYRNDKNIANKKKIENIGTSGVNKLNTNRAEVEKEQRTGRTDAKNDLGKGRADKPGINRVKKPGIGGTNKPG